MREERFRFDEGVLDRFANEHGYRKINTDLSKWPMFSYKKADVRLNFWPTSGTVGSYLFHPKSRKKTQLFRREVKKTQVEIIFRDPRVHTGAGYHRKDELQGRSRTNNEKEDQSVRNRKRERDDSFQPTEQRPAKKARISCRFGVYCERPNCWYEHRCRYGKDCLRPACKYDHSGGSGWYYNQPCRDGEYCTYPYCKFKHYCPHRKRCGDRDCWMEHVY